ncbi:MAG TPA: metal ABC transporter ATP-binding protein [Acidimicrobiales bacterium]|nr:metal ABC transporter ATP-binding protein [Acidimicrobiales bacterium]
MAAYGSSDSALGPALDGGVVKVLAARHPSGRPNVLDVDGVTVRLSGREILHDVSFSIQPGELTGLIGPNGAGKTTILRVVLGLQPASGTVLVDGVPRSRHEQLVGYVPQKVVFDPDLPLRARDVVALGLDGHRLGIVLRGRYRRAERVEEMLDAVGASSFADRRVGNLSGGEQQRVLIAHALVGWPRLLMLDEPLANLDLRSEDEVVALLAKIGHGQDVAVLISAHEMNPLLGVMDRVVYVAGGRAASGTAEEIIRPEVLSKLYGHHVDVLRVHDRVIVVAGANAGISPGAHAGPPDTHAGDTPAGDTTDGDTPAGEGSRSTPAGP